jgi:hypothetical protein
MKIARILFARLLVLLFAVSAATIALAQGPAAGWVAARGLAAPRLRCCCWTRRSPFTALSARS